MTERQKVLYIGFTAMAGFFVMVPVCFYHPWLSGVPIVCAIVWWSASKLIHDDSKEHEDG